MTSETGKQMIKIHILLNISKSKSNQTVKSCQPIDCKMSDIFLEESYTKYG